MLVTHNAAEATPEERFGAQVKEAREIRGWSQEALARHLKSTSGVDLHQTAIARLERGDRAIRFNEVTALCEVLDLSLASYVGSPALLSREEYERAVQEVERLKAEELAARDELARLRDHFAAQEGVTTGRINYLKQQRSRLESAVWAYEENRGATDG